MRVGDIYVFYDHDETYKKVKIINVRGYEQIEMTGIQEKYVEADVVDFEYTDSSTRKKYGSELYQSKRFRKIDREPHCWSCKDNLNEKTDHICPTCGWIVCPNDGGCKCDKP
ncbi:hypothetical protein GCM10008986_09720 [Salinibacillus aidingensis]|uniref:Phage protein n=1 Tax=Salinibacillus aidingensis TaxID=237684 RepID=A0ABP3KSS0_9BACI